MWNEYTREKLLELDSERIRRADTIHVDLRARRARRPLAGAARIAGRGLRRFGEAVESWAAPQADTQCAPEADGR